MHHEGLRRDMVSYGALAARTNWRWANQLMTEAQQQRDRISWNMLEHVETYLGRPLFFFLGGLVVGTFCWQLV